MGLGRLSVRSVRDIRYARASVDRYRPVERETIAHERVPVAAQEPPRRRGIFGGNRHHPVPH